MERKIFILSPAQTSGRKAGYLFQPPGNFNLAGRLHSGEKVAIGEIFSFLSGLYFRGKLAYARKFAVPPQGLPGAFVITSNQGLLDTDTPITLDDLKSFSEVDIHHQEERYLRPLEISAIHLLRKLGPETDVILLGSIATGKYVDVLLRIFKKQFKFPQEFAGRGDMSRGGLMLRCVEANRELTYMEVEGAVRHGPRPAKLERRP